MKTTTLASATPWLASLRHDTTVVHAECVRSLVAPITEPRVLGLATDGAAKLRQEKTARVQAVLGSAAIAYRATRMVIDRPADFGRPVGDPQTTTTANGGVQGSPPWRQPVIT